MSGQRWRSVWRFDVARQALKLCSPSLSANGERQFAVRPTRTVPVDGDEPGTYAFQCLMARRLAERDVRFVQIFHAGWDHHGSLEENLARQTAACDQPTAALLRDLKQRGLLDDTLVVWGGEFGRTAYSQGDELNGRDHHPRCFSIWLAGGGIQPGVTIGSTDDYGYNIVENEIHVRDLHAMPRPSAIPARISLDAARRRNIPWACRRRSFPSAARILALLSVRQKPFVLPDLRPFGLSLACHTSARNA